MKLLNAASLGMALALLFQQQALACRGQQWETVTLLQALPSNIDRPVVARVAIVEVLPPRFPPRQGDWKYSERVTVRVIEAFKGVQEGQTFMVSTGGSSCDQWFSRNRGGLSLQFYIVGQLDEREGELLFTGQWKMDLRTGELLAVR